MYPTKQINLNHTIDFSTAQAPKFFGSSLALTDRTHKLTSSTRLSETLNSQRDQARTETDLVTGENGPSQGLTEQNASFHHTHHATNPMHQGISRGYAIDDHQ